MGSFQERKKTSTIRNSSIMAKALNVGVVGYGLSAKIFHIPFITATPTLTLHSIVQRSPKDGNSAPADHPNLKHYTSADDLLAEKPFVPTSAEADKLIAIAKENSRLICVYQNRRWDSDFLLVKKLAKEGTLGRIVEFNSHFDRYRADAPTNWKGQIGIPQGGSALFDLGTHLIDQAYTLFGLPQSVHGRLLNQREGKADFFNPDAVSAELTYPDGLIVNIRISALSAESIQPRFWVRGFKGSFRKNTLDRQEDQLKAGMKPTEAGFGQDDNKTNARLTLVGEDAKTMKEVDVPELAPETYMAFYRALGDALVSGKEEDIPVKATQARDVLRILEGVVESAKTGKDAVL